MTDEELAHRVAAIQAAARQLVPEWEPWMTTEHGYAGNGRHWLRNAEYRADQRQKRNLDKKRAQRRKDMLSAKARRRYLRRMADPEAYEAYLAKARADQAVRDAAKRAGKT